MPRDAVVEEKPNVSFGPPPIHAASLEALSNTINLPIETMHALVRHGRGPLVFKVGRRLCCRVSDFNRWIDDVATGRLDATLYPRKRVAALKAARAAAAAKPAKRKPKVAPTEADAPV